MAGSHGRSLALPLAFSDGWPSSCAMNMRTLQDKGCPCSVCRSYGYL
jgi:hypothetical protein